MTKFKIVIEATYSEANIAELLLSLADRDADLKELMVADLQRPKRYSLVVESTTEFRARPVAAKYMFDFYGYNADEVVLVSVARVEGEPEVLSCKKLPAKMA